MRPARIGVLTDGVIYKFYADLDKPNKMDKTPFLELDLQNLSEVAVRELSKLTKTEFDPDEAITAASELKYVGGIKSILKSQIEFPSDDFVKVFFKELCPDNVFTGRLKEEFMGYTKRAIKEFIRSEIDNLLNKASGASASTEIQESDSEGKPKEIDLGKQTEFTEDEREGYYILRSILCQDVDPGRITYKDTMTYCNVLLDDNTWRPIVRMHFNTANHRRLEIFSVDLDGNKTSEMVTINNLNELYQYADRFLSIC